MAKIERLPSGLYRTRVYIGRTADGKIKTKSLTHKDKRKLATMAAAYADLHREVKNANSMEKSMQAYIDARKAVLSPSTVKGYNSMLKSLKKHHSAFCALDVDDVTGGDLQTLVAELVTDGKSPKYVRNVISLISASMEASGASVQPVKLPAKKKLTYSIPDEEMAVKIAQDASGTNMEIPIALGMLGLRRSEICGLELSDLDGSILHIHSVVVYGADAKPVRKQTPKTDESDRYIRIPDELADQIRKQGYITHMRPDAITRGFQRLIEKGKYPHIRFHDLRHFFVSYAHTVLGLSDAQIMKLGGWKTSSVMRSVYLQSMEDDEAAKAVSTFVSTLAKKVDTKCEKVDTD